MAIIKSHNAKTLLKEAIVLDLGDVARQAKRLREAAQAKARRIIEDAQCQAESLRQKAHTDSATQGHQEGFEKGKSEGHQQGLREGHQEALDQAKEQLQSLQQAWIEAMGQWEAKRQDMEQEAGKAVLELAVRLGQKLVHRVIQIDKEVAVEQVAAVLSHVLRPVDVTVRICADDRPVLEESMPRLTAEFPQLKHVQLVDDPEMTRGGCVVSYGQGRIDATIETQLERVVELVT